MTPQRARELRIHWMQQVSPGERSYDQMIEQAILAACREERHAAYDDIASVVQPYIILGEGKDGSEIAAALHRAILESRDEP